jgi:hypothetical protein
MKNTKFVVKVNRGVTRAPEYVQRIDRTPIQTTTNRKLALVMGRFTAEDAVTSIQNSRCAAELVSLQVRSAQFYPARRIFTSDARASPPLLSGTMINSRTVTSNKSTA